MEKPNELEIVADRCINGEFSYHGQENIYLFKASKNGKYYFSVNEETIGEDNYTVFIEGKGWGFASFDSRKEYIIVIQMEQKLIA